MAMPNEERERAESFGEMLLASLREAVAFDRGRWRARR